MKTNEINEIRDVAPQWCGGKGGNLGDFTLATVGISPSGVMELAKEPGMAAAMADVLNNQLHIRFASSLCESRVVAELKKMGIEKGEGEKWDAFAARTLTDAREVAKTVLKDFVLDELGAFRRWATEDFPKRGQRSDKRPVLADFDKIVGGVETHWATMAEEKKAALLERLKLDADLRNASDVIAAITKKYQRPVSVDAESLFE